MWQLSIGYFVCGITTASISVHFIKWAISENISPYEAAFSFSVLSAVNGISVIASGYFSDKFESYIAPDVKWNLKSKMTNQSNILNRINETNHKFIDILMLQINIENQVT